MSKNLLYLGLDVHAQTVAIAIAEADGEVRNYGSVSGDLGVLEKTMRRIINAHPGSELRVCYEAGPTGFVIARRFAQLGIDCTVVAPSLPGYTLSFRPGQKRFAAEEIADLFAELMTGVLG